MIKLLLQLASGLRLAYWWLIRPTTRGARAIVVNTTGEVLLVKHKYAKGWFLPGGKSRKNESQENTIKRELKEELGISEYSSIKMLGEFINSFEFKKDTIAVYVVHIQDFSPKLDFEIEEWSFFVPNNLPADVSPGTRRRISEWINAAPLSPTW